MLLAQLSLRPIHVIRSGLTRLGHGEFGVVVDLPQRDEFGELGDFFKTVSARLSADRPPPGPALLGGLDADRRTRSRMPSRSSTPTAKLLFANRRCARSCLAGPPDPVTRSVRDLFAAAHPYRKAVEEAAATRQSHGPIAAYLPSLATDRVDENGLPAPRERLILTHVIDERRSPARRRDARRAQPGLPDARCESTFSYSRKLAALSRLSAGVAHEVKNPLNATMIHLELLKQQLAQRSAARDGAPVGHHGADAPPRRSRAGVPPVHPPGGSASCSPRGVGDGQRHHARRHG